MLQLQTFIRDLVIPKRGLIARGICCGAGQKQITIRTMAMNQRLSWLGIGVVLLAACGSGCSKKQGPPPAQDASPGIDHIVITPPKPPKSVVNKTFPVKTYEAFEFVVPAHTVTPKLEGSFQSFVKGNSENIVSNDTADVDVLLMNEQEFDVFKHGKQGTATYTADPSHSQTVEVALASTVDDHQTYYLVFRNPPGGPRTKFVKADFTASFE
jgi:hypothetical protein